MATFNPNFPQVGDPQDNLDPFHQNWKAINESFEKDHTLFSDPVSQTNGHHRQVFYNAPLMAPAPVPTGTQSVSYSMPGIATASNSQLFWQTPGGISPLSAIKAYAFVTTGGGGAPTLTVQKSNVTSVVLSGVAGSFSTYNIVTTGLVGVQFSVLITPFGATGPNEFWACGYNITGANTFNISFNHITGGGQPTPPQFSFMVLQL